MGGHTLFSELELYILLIILQLGEGAYGVSISAEIEVVHSARVSTSAIYAALDRLGSHGLVSSELGEATPERGGRAKRYFRVTDHGLAALQQTRSSLGRLWRYLPTQKGSA